VLLIDTGPDLAHQLRDPFRTWDGRRYPADCLTRCDGVLITHDHADHSHGLNDLRHLNRLMGGQSITLHGDAAHLDELRRMFPYCFSDPDRNYVLANPALLTLPLAIGERRCVGDLAVERFTASHGCAGSVSGWILGGTCVYLTDAKELPTALDERLRGMDLLVLNMLQEQPHPTHFCWDEALAVLDRLRPRRTVLTHMGYSVRWADWQARLPPGVSMAYDGLCLEWKPA
jgi:phosphoribosyl 1,2-cyclic phosphate phosphodiesterase